MTHALLSLTLGHAVPAELNVLAWLCIPLLAFALPAVLAKRMRPEQRAARLPAMLVAAVPCFVLAAIGAALASGSWFQGIDESATEIVHAKRYPPSVLALFVRTGVAGLGAFALIWLSGLLAERSAKRAGDAGTNAAESEAHNSDPGANDTESDGEAKAQGSSSHA